MGTNKTIANYAKISIWKEYRIPYILNMKGNKVCSKFGPDILVPIRKVNLSEEDSPRSEQQSFSTDACNENINLMNHYPSISKNSKYVKQKQE